LDKGSPLTSRLRVAVVVESTPSASPEFRRALSMTRLLATAPRFGHVLVVFVAHEETRQILLRAGVESIVIPRGLSSVADRWSASPAGETVLGWMRAAGASRAGRSLDAVFDDHGIDIVFFTATEGAARVGDHPFIVTLPDLGHRDHPDLPEAFRDRGFERRERAIESSVVRAVAVVVHSPHVGARLAELYHVDPRRIVVFPPVPDAARPREADSTTVDQILAVRRLYKLPERFLFFPAAYAPGRNHRYILDGLVSLEQAYGITLDAVFAGVDAGNLDVVRRQITALGIDRRARTLGVVPDEHVPGLYAAAMVVVDPSVGGSATLPLEAMVNGRPVICADREGVRAQLGDAALYCDLSRPESLADHLATVLRDPGHSSRLRDAGARVARETAEVNFAALLAPVLDEFARERTAR
jgi:glycosyltransferase involved in cell wall biosynthesis